MPVRASSLSLMTAMLPGAEGSFSISTWLDPVFRFRVRSPSVTKFTSPWALTVISPPTATTVRSSSVAMAPVAALITASPAARISPAPMSPVRSVRKMSPVLAMAFSSMPLVSSVVRSQSSRTSTSASLPVCTPFSSITPKVTFRFPASGSPDSA